MNAEQLATARSDRLGPSQDDFDDFFEHAGLPLHVVSGDGIIVRANRAELEMLGYAEQEYLGRHVAEFHVDRSAIADILERLARGEPVVSRAARLRAKDGGVRDVRVSSTPRTRRGAMLYARCCTIDVTDLVRVERRLRESERRAAATYEHAAIGIAEVDARGTLLRVNAQLAALLGYSPRELEGRSIFDPALAEIADEDKIQFERQARGEIDRYAIEKRFLRADGGRLWTAIVSSAIRDDEGRFLYAVRVQQDITVRKETQEALARRVEEQAALYEFTEALRTSESLDAVYRHAVNAIVRALRCERAAILILDAAGAMKFVAWRGLSDRYRAAVDGHSPWRADTPAPAPIAVDDIATAELPGDLKGHVRAEGIAALSFVPIVADGRLIGKFMTYYDRPHRFTEAELTLALTVARQLGLAIEQVAAETARRAAERAAQQLAAIVESSDDAIISKDLDGNIVTWNPGAERLFGYAAEEAIGRSVTLIFPPGRIAEENAILARINAGERVHDYETVRRRKDGSLVDISLTVSPVRNRRGEIVGASKIARDITERKKAEARLRESERRLQELIAAIPAAIYMTDARGRITYFNQAAADLAGRTPVIGTDEWCVTWKLYRPDGTPLPHDQCPMAVALREGRPIRDAEAIAERPDGTRIPFLPYPTPLRDADGNIVGAINMLVDISERRTAETRQRVLFNELNHRVKNNMQTLQSLLHLAGRKAKSAEAKETLREAGGRVAAMAAAQQVLYGTLNTSRFSARQFLEAVRKAVAQSLSPAVRIAADADDFELPIDVSMPLALIMNELITNAVKHGTRAGEQGGVRVRLAECRNECVLDVEDDGPGFALSEVLPRSSGLRLVQGLAAQIRGTFDVVKGPPARCTVRFYVGDDRDAQESGRY